MSAPEEDPNRSRSVAAFAVAALWPAAAAITRSWTGSMWAPPAAASRMAAARSLVRTDRTTAESAGSTVGSPMARKAKRMPDSASSPAGVRPGPRPPSARAVAFRASSGSRRPIVATAASMLSRHGGSSRTLGRQERKASEIMARAGAALSAVGSGNGPRQPTA